MKKNKTSVTWIHALVSILGTCYLYFVGKTSFIRTWDNPAFLYLRRKRKPAIFAFWHNNQVFLTYAHRGESISVMVSQSKDGEYIAQVMKWLRLVAVRGSTTRGGEQALRELISVLEGGGQIGFTPDGPKGPAQTVHGGVVMAAQLSGCPIIPTTSKVRLSVEFRSWDRFVLPLPFSRAVVSHGKPFFIPKEMTEEDAKEKIRNELNQLTEKTNQIENGSSTWLEAFAGRCFLFGYDFLSVATLPVWLPILMLKYGVRRSWKNITDRLGAAKIIPATDDKKRLWFHVASVGEWQALRPLFLLLKNEAQFEFYLTVSTPEAKQLIQRDVPGLAISLLPADLPFVMSRWIQKMDPYAFILVETEVWPNLLIQLAKKNIPIFVVNGRLSERSARLWSLIKPFISMILEGISHFYVRSKKDAELFQRVGANPERIKVTGNLKIDNMSVPTLDDRSHYRKTQFGFQDGLILLGGSTGDGEEETLIRIYQKIRGIDFRLILAPRHVSRVSKVEKLLKSRNISYGLWSKAKKAHMWAADVLIVDTLGDLKTLYFSADMVFVGGTLNSKGGQNPLEPAAAGNAIVFGPSMENFEEEARLLLEANAAIQIRDENQLSDVFRQLLANPTDLRLFGERAQSVVRSQQGVAQLVKDDILKQLRYEQL